MTKIDDEMVERAVVAYMTSSWAGPPDSQRIAIRAALEAALSPKPEPEIEVSEGMRKAGGKALSYLCTDYADDFACDVYRAMESTRLKEWRTRDGHLPGDAPSGAKSAPQGVSAAAPVKETGGAGRVHTHRRHGDAPNHPDGYGPPAFHRRKDDPK